MLEFTPDVLHHIELPAGSDHIYRKSEIILPVYTRVCPSAHALDCPLLVGSNIAPPSHTDAANVTH